jgi:hypothetical protein
LGLPVKGHTWQDEKNWGYRSYTDAESLTEAYLRLVHKLHPLTGARGLAAAVYTQTTDVEIEVNGLLTYDRALIKMDPATVAAANRALYTPPAANAGKLVAIVPAADERPATWRYTTEKPADDWPRPGFDDSKWRQGKSGFGTEGTPGAIVGTTWNTSDIWLRREFEMPPGPWDGVQLWMHHDEDAHVYINGVLAARTTGWTGEYETFPLRPAGRAALKPGKNVMAVHCRQTAGGQYIDAGLAAPAPAQSGASH